MKKNELIVKKRMFSILLLTLFGSLIIQSCKSKAKKEAVLETDSISETVQLDPIQSVSTDSSQVNSSANNNVVANENNTVNNGTVENNKAQQQTLQPTKLENSKTVKVKNEPSSSEGTKTNKSTKQSYSNNLKTEMNDVGEYFYMANNGEFETLKENVIADNGPILIKKDGNTKVMSTQKTNAATKQNKTSATTEIIEESASVSSGNNSVQEKVIEIKEN